MDFRNRPVYKGDIGSYLRIIGLIVGASHGEVANLLLPGHFGTYTTGSSQITVEPTLEEWSDFIRRSDDPEILIGNSKIFQRKVRYDISGAIQQRVWAADGFKCMYCSIPFGKRLMTIDHFWPLELDGANDTTNYLSACKSCNKEKANTSPIEFFRKGEYERLSRYLKERKI